MPQGMESLSLEHSGPRPLCGHGIDSGFVEKG